MNPCVSENGKAADYTAPADCTNGTVDWNYPRSTIRVHFINDKIGTFQVCFKDSLGGSQFGLMDVTNGAHRSLPTLSRDSKDPICVQSVKGEVVLQVQASEMQTYMGAFDYKIVTS